MSTKFAIHPLSDKPFSLSQIMESLQLLCSEIVKNRSYQFIGKYISGKDISYVVEIETFEPMQITVSNLSTTDEPFEFFIFQSSTDSYEIPKHSKAEIDSDLFEKINHHSNFIEFSYDRYFDVYDELMIVCIAVSIALETDGIITCSDRFMSGVSGTNHLPLQITNELKSCYQFFREEDYMQTVVDSLKIRNEVYLRYWPSVSFDQVMQVFEELMVQEQGISDINSRLDGINSSEVDTSSPLLSLVDQPHLNLHVERKSSLETILDLELSVKKFEPFDQFPAPETMFMEVNWDEDDANSQLEYLGSRYSYLPELSEIGVHDSDYKFEGIGIVPFSLSLTSSDNLYNRSSGYNLFLKALLQCVDGLVR